MTLQIPPLPPQWPYPPRGPQPAPESHAQAALPGLPGRWILEAVPGLALDEAAAGLGQAFGRGGVLRAGTVVLRPYRRGGLVRHVNERIYLGHQRFQEEFQVHRALWAAGLPTVEPLGWAYRPRLWGCEGVFLTRLGAGVPWPRAWDQHGVAPQLRALLEALCGWGLYAPDLNATNVLVDPSGAILTLDWDRARWMPGDGLMERYRERLTRSLAKLGAPREIISQV
ncbi:MAG: hypothetical protein P4L36_16790 [Holophaga sp.]|nr:hypothetical protein [Holophaga sp.]